MATAVGVIGLGQMGAPIASRIADQIGPVVAFDASPHTSLVREGIDVLASVADIATRATTIVLSLPDAAVVLQVCSDIAATAGRRTTTVVDCSTIGVDGAGDVAEQLGRHGIVYVDAAVSGGVAGAERGTLTTMCACPASTFEAIEPLLAAWSSSRYLVGTRPGMGQAAKVANNFLSATALVATSEAVAFGRAQGIDPGVLLEVFNASSGRNTATSDKFPKHVITGTYAAGFSNAMMYKDVALYAAGAAGGGRSTAVGAAVVDAWRRFATDEPGADITRIHPFLGQGDTE